MKKDYTLAFDYCNTMQKAKSHGDSSKVTKPVDLRLPKFIAGKLAKFYSYKRESQFLAKIIFYMVRSNRYGQ